MIEAKNISLQKSGKPILKGIDLKIEAGEFIGLIGPNGAGKSSLMRSLLRLENKAKGSCNLWDMRAKERAQQVGWLAQERHLAWDMDVGEVIELGRIAWRSGFAYGGQKDAEIIGEIAERLGLNPFMKRAFHSLSGGERARVLLARLLAQDTPFMIADEPIDALDPSHQIQMMESFKILSEEGKSVMISIHDLGLAARFCDRLVLMNEGRIIADGQFDNVLSDKNLREIFHIEAFRAEKNGPILQPINRLEG